MKILFYKNRRIPVLDFIDVMVKRDQAKVLACLKSIEDLGFDSPRIRFRQIRGKLWEIKIRASRTGYRIFYVGLYGDVLVLLHVYRKQSQKAPNKEIAIAEKRLLEVLENESDYIK